MYKIGYEQTDEKILVDIYGLPFEVKRIDKSIIDEIKKIKEEVNNIDELYKYVDMFLGEGATEKINAKREQDGYEKMNYEVILAIIELVFRVQKEKIDKINNRMNYYEKNYRRKRY